MLYCVQRRNGSYRLALFSKKTGEAKSISMAFAGISQVSVSPAGRRIAAAVKPVGGPWGIAVFLESGTLDRFLTVAGSNLSQPRWQDDEKLIFIVNGKETSALASYALDMNSGWRFEDPRFSGARQFDLSADGQEIFIPISAAAAKRSPAARRNGPRSRPWKLPRQREFPQPRRPRPRQQRFGPAPLPPDPRPAAALVVTALRADGDEIQAGIITGGQDALGIHSYDMEGYLGFSSHRPSLRLRYIYDGCSPPFRSPMPTAVIIIATLGFSGAPRR